MNIQNATTGDIAEIFRLYAIASAYQKSIKAVVVWPVFDPELVITEIAESRQWKLMMGDDVACIWATTFSDPQIWEERNSDKAIYIHRIATNPNYRGHNFVATIVAWAKGFAKENQLNFVRLDTIGNNTKLIEHYTKAGFDFLGMFELKDTKGLPDHYHYLPACLFQISVA